MRVYKIGSKRDEGKKVRSPGHRAGLAGRLPVKRRRKG
jgi:hypothetical protein